MQEIISEGTNTAIDRREGTAPNSSELDKHILERLEPSEGRGG